MVVLYYFGINKPIIKCHGSAKSKIIKYTLLQAESFAKHNVVESIKQGIASKRDQELKN
jgi:fatty acid/phospholipid biosynthesis enzyme